MADPLKNRLDGLDKLLIAELEVDAHQSTTQIARKLMTSRATVHSKMKRLLAERIIAIVPIVDPLAMAYETRVMIGVNTLPNRIDAVADALAAYRRIRHVAIFTGRYDVMAWAVLKKPEDLSDFVRTELTQVPGIIRAETMVNLEMAKVSYAFLAEKDHVLKEQPPQQPLDNLDLRLIRQLRDNPLQTHAELATAVGTSTSSARRRLQRLLDENIVRIVAIAAPVALGYRTRATIGINVQPSKIDAVVEKLVSFECCHHILINTGQFDLIVSADFRGPENLSRFIRQELGAIHGLLSHETMICLKVTKNDLSSVLRER